MRYIFLLPCVALLAACANIPGQRGFYEGLRQENLRRQNEPGRDISRDPAPPSYEAYEKERQRLKEDPSQ